MKKALIIVAIISIFMWLSFATGSCIGTTANFTCGETITESCTLNESLNCDNTLNTYSIIDDNIILNCSGYSITTTGSENNVIYIQGSNDTIVNCNIVSSSSNTGGAIGLNGSGANILNNNINAYASTAIIPISYTDISNTTISNNIFNAYGGNIINLYYATNIIMTNNLLNDSNTCLEIGYINDSIFINNTFDNCASIGVYLSESYNNLFINNSNEINYNGATQMWYSENPQNISSYGNVGWFPLLESDGSDAIDQTYTTWYNGSKGGRNADWSLNSSLHYWYNNQPVGFGCVGAITTYFCGDTITESCTLEGNITIATGSCFIIETNNTVIDCAGFSMDGGDKSGSAIDATPESAPIENLTIQNCEFFNWSDAIYYANIYNSALTDTVFHDNMDAGIWIWNPAENISIDNITSYNDTYTIYIESGTNINFTNSNQLGGSYQLIYAFATNLFIENITSTLGTDAAIYIDMATYCTVNNIASVADVYGIYSLCEYGSFTNISTVNSTNGGVYGGGSYSNYSAMTSSGDYIGLQISGSNNIIDGISVDAAVTEGIYLVGADNVINNTNITNSLSRGIYLEYAVQAPASNNITNNRITNSSPFGYGIQTYGSYGNLFDNNFLNNTNNVDENTYRSGIFKLKTYYGSPSDWNTTATTFPNIYGTNAYGGNFYAQPDGLGYSQTCADVLPHDGYCDAAYTIPMSGIYATTNSYDYLAIAKPQPSFSDYYFGYYDHLQSNASQIDDLVDTYGYNLIGQTVDFTNLTSETITSSSSCYQGFANETSPCGGLDSGTYGIGGNGAWTFGGNATFDGNRSSGDFAVMDIGWALTNITYYKPINASGMVVQVSTGDNSIGGVTTANFTVPASCWNYNDTWVKLQGFSAASSFPLDYAAGVFCDNGSIVAGHYSITVEMNTTTPYFDELEAFWNITNTSETHNQFNDYETNANYTFSVKNAVSFLDLDFTKYSSYESFDAECGNITYRFDEILVSPYQDATGFILISVNESATGGALSVAQFINGIGNCTQTITNKQFGIYTTADMTGVSPDWVRTLPSIVIYNDTLDNVITTEMSAMQNNLTLSRIYSVSTRDALSTEFKNFSSQYHFGVINALRASPNAVGAIWNDAYTASLSNGDFVVFNPTGSDILYNSWWADLILTGEDAWEYNHKLLVVRNYDGGSNLDINISADFATVVYVDTFSKIEMTSSILSTLYKNATGENYTMNNTQNGAADGSFIIGGDNDARVEMWSPDYGFHNLAMVSYEQIEYTQVVDFSNYEVIIIVGGANSPADVNASLNVAAYPTILDKAFGYISVYDYNNLNSSGGNETNCSAVNPWETAKIAEAANWTDNYSMNVFTDGIDLGYAGDTSCFEERNKRLLDFVRINKSKETTCNSYTIYQTITNYCDHILRESCFSRWAGNVSNPTYSYENHTLMVLNAEYLTTVGKPVVCMAFGDASDFDKMMFDYHAFAVLYGADGQNSFRYGQPNFQLQQDIRVPDFGTMMERTYNNDSPTDWKRRYSNGVAHYNPLRNGTYFPNGKYYYFENDEVVSNLTVNTFFQIYSDCSDQSNINLTVQTVEANTSFIINGSEIGNCVAWAGGYVSRDILNLSSPAGHYYLTYSPDNRSKTNGINIWNRANTHGGVHSWYNTNASNPPISEGEWTACGRSGTVGDTNTTNWNANIYIEKTTAAAVDSNVDTILDIDTVLSGFNNVNITLSSVNFYTLPIISLPIYLAYQHVVNVTYNGTILNVSSQADCVNNPTFNYSDIEGELHGVCRQLNGSSGYTFRFAAPHLTIIEYDILTNQSTPTIDFTSNNPINDTHLSVNYSYFEIEYTYEVGTTIANTTLVLNNGTEYEMICNATNCWLDQTFADGSYSYYAFINNTWGNFNTTEIRNITFDTISPAITIQSPTNSTYQITTIPLNYTVNETNLDTCWYSLNNGANITLSGNTTFNVTQAVNSIKITCNDTSSNENSSLVSFFVYGCIGATQVFVCGDTITESCTMNGNLTAPNHCFTIDTPDVTIDCAGFSITATSPSAFTSLLQLGGGSFLRNNITAKNCVVSTGNWNIYLNYIANATVSNCTGLNSSYSELYLNGAAGASATLKDNTIVGSLTEMYGGIAISGGTAILINNTIANANYGVYITGATSILFINNTNEIAYNGTGQKFYSDGAQNISSYGNLGWFPLLASNGADAVDHAHTAWYNGTNGGRNADWTVNPQLKFWYNQTNPACVANATTSYVCGDTITKSCTMNGNMNSSNTCFTINTNNIQINCSNYYIKGIDVNYGIKFNGNNSNATNCNISTFLGSIGIFGNNNTITNSVLHGNSGYPIYIIGSDNILINDTMTDLPFLYGNYAPMYIGGSNNLFINNTNGIEYNDTNLRFKTDSRAQNKSSYGNVGWWPLITSDGSDTGNMQSMTAWYNGSVGGRNADGSFNGSLKYWYNQTNTITFVEPTDNSSIYVNKQDILFNVTSSFSDNITVNLYNSTGALMNSTYNQSTSIYGILGNALDGVYYFNATGTYTGVNPITTETRNITFDMTSPLVDYTLTNPTDNSYTKHNYVYFEVNYTEINKNNTLLQLNGTNYTMFCNTTNCYYNKTTMSDGIYTYDVYINDLAGNANVTTLRTVTVDTTLPVVSYTSSNPANDAVVTSGNDLYFEVNYTEVNFNSTKIKINGISIVMTCNTTHCYYNYVGYVIPYATYNITMTDLAGNSFTTPTRNVTAQTNASCLSFVKYVSLTQNLVVQANIDETSTTLAVTGWARVNNTCNNSYTGAFNLNAYDGYADCFAPNNCLANITLLSPSTTLDIPVNFTYNLDNTNSTPGILPVFTYQNNYQTNYKVLTNIDSNISSIHLSTNRYNDLCALYKCEKSSCGYVVSNWQGPLSYTGNSTNIDYTTLNATDKYVSIVVSCGLNPGAGGGGGGGSGCPSGQILCEYTHVCTNYSLCTNVTTINQTGNVTTNVTSTGQGIITTNILSALGSRIAGSSMFGVNITIFLWLLFIFLILYIAKKGIKDANPIAIILLVGIGFLVSIDYMIKKGWIG